MEEKALQYYKQGYNCSQCILKAAEQVYKIPLSKQCGKMCSAVSSGFGIGSTCSVVIAGIMVFGLLFDETTAKRLRMILLLEFKDKYKSFNCCDLAKGRENNDSCQDLVYDTAAMISRIVQGEMKS